MKKSKVLYFTILASIILLSLSSFSIQKASAKAPSSIQVNENFDIVVDGYQESAWNKVPVTTESIKGGPQCSIRSIHNTSHIFFLITVQSDLHKDDEFVALLMTGSLNFQDSATKDIKRIYLNNESYDDYKLSENTYNVDINESIDAAVQFYPNPQLHNWTVYEFSFPLYSDDKEDVLWEVNSSYSAKIGLGEGPDYSFLKTSDFFFVRIGVLPHESLSVMEIAIIIACFIGGFLIEFIFRAFGRSEPVEDYVYITSLLPANVTWFLLSQPRVFHTYGDYAALLSMTLLIMCWLAAEIRDIIEYRLIAQGKIRKKRSRKGIDYIGFYLFISFIFQAVYTSIGPAINPLMQYGTRPYWGMFYFPDLNFFANSTGLLALYRLGVTFIVLIAIFPLILDVQGQQFPLWVCGIFTFLFIIPIGIMGYVLSTTYYPIIIVFGFLGVLMLFLAITQSAENPYEENSVYEEKRMKISKEKTKLEKPPAQKTPSESPNPEVSETQEKEETVNLAQDHEVLGMETKKQAEKDSLEEVETKEIIQKPGRTFTIQEYFISVCIIPSLMAIEGLKDLMTRQKSDLWCLEFKTATNQVLSIQGTFKPPNFFLNGLYLAEKQLKKDEVGVEIKQFLGLDEDKGEFYCKNKEDLVGILHSFIQVD